ncbi:glycosyltransferase family 4 protein [Psychroserpens sp. MEBiC05023]
MEKPLKVAIYTGVTKSTTFIERLVKGLAVCGTSVYVFGAYSGKLSKTKNVNYIYHKKKWHKLWVLLKYTILLILFKPKERKTLDNFISTKQKNKRLLRLKYYPVLYHKPDIFHIQWAKSIDDWIWVKDFGMALVVSLRGAHINYSPILDVQLASTYKKWFPKVAAFHAVSSAIALEATKYNAPLKHIKVIKSGLKLDEFKFELKEFNCNSLLNIVSVGRDHWKKNYTMSLDVMSKLKQNGIAFHYTIIGTDQSEPLIYQRAQLDLISEISFVDALPFEEVQSAIKRADVMLLPSVEEGIANVVLEAMALGTLVISTDCGGMAEVVIPNKTGFLIPNRDVQSAFEAIKKVSQLSATSYREITKEARAYIEKHHNENLMVEQMQNLYTNLKFMRL